MSDYVDFKAIKAAVSVGAVTTHYGVKLRRMNATHERGQCPLPGHPVGDEKETFSVNAEKQVWICHSTICTKTRKGKKGGDVIELVATMESCSLREAGLKLGQWFSISKAPEPVGSSQPAEASHPVADDCTMSNSREYGIYKPLADWIEKRISSNGLSRFEQSAYLSVLGQIEELANAEKADFVIGRRTN